MATALNLLGSPLAASAPLTVTIDTSDPSLSLTAPVAGWAHSSTARLIGSASDTGGGVPNVQYSLDGGSLSSVPVSAAGQFDAAIAGHGLGFGDHNVGVIAADTAGNQTSQSVNFSVTENFLVVLQSKDTELSLTPAKIGYNDG